MASINSLVILAILAGLLASCSAETANAEYTDKAPRHHHRGSGQPDLDHDKLPRKAVMLKDTEKGDKAAVLKVMVTLSEGQKTCPSKHGDMESMRQYVADAFEIMLKRAHVEAKLKTGTLGCEAILDDDCTKIVLQFVVKLHAKKGSDLLSKFVHVITTAAYSHRSICDIQELGCHAHHVASIEVEQLAKKPHGTKLHKHKDANDEDGSDTDEQDDGVFSGYSTWTKKTHHSKKHGRYGKHKGAAFEEEAGEGDGYGYGSSSYGSDGSSYDGSDAAYGLKAAAVTKPAAAAPAAAQEAASFKVDTRLWPQESLKAVAAKAAAAKAAAAAAAAAMAAAAKAAAATASKTAAKATASSTAAVTAPASTAAATAAVSKASSAASTASATAATATGAAITAMATAASAQPAAAAAAAAAAPQQLNVVPFDARLWPIMPSAQKAAPML